MDPALKSTPAEIERILAALGEMHARMHAFMETYSPGELAFSPDKKTRSAQEILTHLRACADLWTHSIYAMLVEVEPLLPDIDERKYARAARYQEVPFREALEDFSARRANLMRVLHEIEPKDWERGVILLGRRHTVFSQARRMAKHEAEHFEQLSALGQ